MLLLHFFLVVLPLLLGIHADVVDDQPTPEVVNSIQNVEKLTVEMASVVQKWNGDVLAALPINDTSDSLIKAIKDGAETAKKSKKMGVGEALKVKKATKQLLKEIKSSLGTITSSKPKFDNAGLTSIMKARLQETKTASDSLIEAIVDKLPKVGKRIGRNLGKKIAAEFDSAIAEFSKAAKNPKKNPKKNLDGNHLS
ncbi:hypothetical protein KVR01_011071 [Diaporthe batatas]|uniref:uncharacterized protein n=1 Tax=Diaporthe batatas TaxID=748121 RepID=UPI001D04DBB9|nr:uncharacterized protein KVR01_011071 [Diaporthe batatas]KAG8159410.1 hypothetical protein KVR01_011071 [Diaporthe batatas]